MEVKKVVKLLPCKVTWVLRDTHTLTRTLTNTGGSPPVIAPNTGTQVKLAAAMMVYPERPLRLLQ